MPNIVKHVIFRKTDANGKVLEERYEEHMQGPTVEELQERLKKELAPSKLSGKNLIQYATFNPIEPELSDYRLWMNPGFFLVP